MKMGRSVLGEFVPAMYSIPANPVMIAFASGKTDAGGAATAPSTGYGAYDAYGGGGMGRFVPASFSVPQNPLLAGSGARPNVLSASGFGAPKSLIRPMKNMVVDAHRRMKHTGPLGTGMHGVHGLGAFDFTSPTNFFTSVTSGSTTIAGVTLQNYLIVGGALALLLLVGGGASRHRR